MLTRCPHCAAVFRLQAVDLTAARGFVTCGACDQVFFALEALADDAPPVVITTATVTTSETEALPQVLRDVDEEPPELGAAPLLRASGTRPAVSSAPAVPALEGGLSRRQQRRQARRVRRWALFAAVLLVLFAGQVAWVARGALMDRFPQLTPWLEALCRREGCRLRPVLSPPRIELLSRDVREHPRYRDVLLVNATLINHEKRRAAYPVLQLSLYDGAGHVIGLRRFEPTEYLDASVDLLAGMPAEKPIYIALEIAGVGTQAEGYEFTFL